MVAFCWIVGVCSWLMFLFLAVVAATVGNDMHLVGAGVYATLATVALVGAGVLSRMDRGTTTPPPSEGC